MAELSAVLPVIIDVLLIVLLTTLIILTIKCIYIINDAKKVVNDINEKVNSLNGLFAIVEMLSNYVGELTEKLHDLLESKIGKVLSKKKKKEDE